MDDAIKKEIRTEINRNVDLMIQADSIREATAGLKEDIKEQYDIPVTTITKVANLVRKQNLEDEDAKWEEIKEFAEFCSK